MARRGGIKSFAQIAVEHGLASEEQMDTCRQLQEQARLAGDDVPDIEKLVLEKKFMKEEEVRAVKIAIGRLTRDEAQGDPYRIRGYEIFTKIGEGGLGLVFKSRQLSMGRIVALKVLHKKWLSDEEFKKRFLLEARLVGRLSHQNLIQVIDVGKDQDSYYFSMEYIDGRTVEDRIDQDGPLPLDKALDITTQVLRAVKYIWGRKIVHRDIKPGNIMLTKNGLAKLGDFGFVKSKFDAILSTEGEVLGTPDYISPEQAMGHENIDVRSDIYSLGITLYHMVTGRPPYEGSGSQVMRKHVVEALPSPKTLNPDIPDSICHIIEKMTAKEPDDRYLSPDELFEDLELIRIGREPASDRPDAGKSTIIRAYRAEHSRADKLEDEIEELRGTLVRTRTHLKLVLIAMAVALGAALVLIIILVSN